MTHFQKIGRIDPAPLLAEVLSHPELWGQNPDRGVFSHSPHREMQDIWLRFRDRKELEVPEDFYGPHVSVWYPAWSHLPAARSIVFDLMRQVEATQLGGILITKIPPGKQIYPHHDRGRWHAEWYNYKVYVPIQAPEGCVNIAEPYRIHMRSGELWYFDNQVVHSVENHGKEDRISLIVTMRVEND